MRDWLWDCDCDSVEVRLELDELLGELLGLGVPDGEAVPLTDALADCEAVPDWLVVAL